MRFPVFALIAPILTSLVLWMVTKSPYTLLFALMGPVMAVASFLDARFGERRRQRQEDLASENEKEEALARAQRAGADRRRERRHSYPASAELAALDSRARPPWNPDFSLAGTVRLGLFFDCDVAVPGQTVGDGGISSHEMVPLTIDASAGITCVGNPLYSLSLARALWAQLAWNVAPATLALHATGHDRDSLGRTGAWPVRLVDSEARIAPGARYVIEIVSPNEGRLSDRDNSRQGFTSFIPDYFTAVEAVSFAQRLAHTSQQIEQSHPSAQLPAHCLLHDVSGTGASDEGLDTISRSTLLAAVGVSQHGVLELDLVVHGPHAVVAGMTGTGKTEFLLSWILSSALRYSPAEFTVLIIDFKGGSGFARIAALPHCLGIVTDLDIGAAQRALHSLRAELRFRERVINQAGVTDFRDLPRGVILARLVIVVDEYRALLDQFSELQPLFLDIAARGRALGVHLILGTQRATGVLADGILANCALRVVFRVNNIGDSMALLESDAARTLPETPGRAVVRGTALALTFAQVAQSSSAEALRVAEHAGRWLAVHPAWNPRRPWLPELPATVSLAELAVVELEAAEVDRNLTTAPGALVLGLVDQPEEQRQQVTHYLPTRDGHLLVLGEQGSGKSTALHLLAGQTREHVTFGDHNPEEAWDGIGGVGDDTLVLIDNIEALLAEFTFEHRDIFLESLMRLLRMGPQRGIFVVVASQSGSNVATAWMALMKSTLTLGLSPGRGVWSNHALQIAQPPAPPVLSDGAKPRRLPPLMTWQAGHVYVVVTARPRLRLAELEGDNAAGPNAVESCPLHLTDVGRLPTDLLEVHSDSVAQVFLGDVEDWQSQFALLNRLRSNATFIFDDCSPAEVRAVRRSRDVLPHTDRGSAISLDSVGVTSRVRLT